MKYDLHLTNQMGGKGRIVLINIYRKKAQNE